MSIDEFESEDLPSGPSVPEQVVRYLSLNREHAFTRSEIATAIGAQPNTVGTALSRLKDRELVRHKGEYWAITDDQERVRSAYRIHGATERLDADDGGIDPDEWDAVAADPADPADPESDDSRRDAR